MYCFGLSVLCPSLTVEDGSVTVTGLTPGSRATYTCDIGFELVGTGFRTCLTSGVWSGTDPVCNEGVLLALIHNIECYMSLVSVIPVNM